MEPGFMEIGVVSIHTYMLVLLLYRWYTLWCFIYLPVQLLSFMCYVSLVSGLSGVLNIDFSVSAWY